MPSPKYVNYIPVPRRRKVITRFNEISGIVVYSKIAAYVADL